jgi:tRNA dimethylallyltransferase
MAGAPPRPLVAVVGPTASGKSDLALRLALTFDGEIVGADSRQVYRYMDAGTAKPSAADRARVAHWLIDVVDPDADFSLAQYLDLAREALDGVCRRGRVPFLVGGTGQYVWALIEGWQVPRIPPDRELRRSLEERAQRDGIDALYSELVAIDAGAAARIDPRNLRRVVRALEVRYLTGEAMSSVATKLQPDFQPLILAIDRPRAELYRRIDERVDRMLESGLVDEVRSLLERGYGCDLPPMSGIGYRQVCAYVRGEMTLPEVAGKMKTESHRLARMQYTWFHRDDPRIRWLDASAGDVYEKAAVLVETALRRRGRWTQR